MEEVNYYAAHLAIARDTAIVLRTILDVQIDNHCKDMNEKQRADYEEYIETRIKANGLRVTDITKAYRLK